MHLGHPVAQRVHDELQDLRGTHEEGVAGAGRVKVVLPIPIDQAIVGGVVDSAEGQGWSQVVALRRVVVDDVQDDLDVGRVQRLDHRLELGDLRARLTGCGVGIVRREVADRVVSPVVGEPLGLEGRVVGELLDRHQFDRGDPELLEVFDDRRVGHSGIGSSQFLGDVRVAHRHALDVGLVDDGLRVVVPRPVVALPVEEWVDDDRVHRCFC